MKYALNAFTSAAPSISATAVAIAVAFTTAPAAGAQSVVTYRLDGGFAAEDAGFPALDTIGAGGFVADTLVELEGFARTSYRFERGSGIAFDNGEAGDFLGESYTIELYFRFDDLASWRRIIDYKDRQTDDGLYAKDGRINFYNVTTSPEAPLATREYAHVIVTRDAAEDDRYAIYVDGELATAFADDGERGLLSERSDSVVLFRDDLVVSNEESAGNVSLIRFYDYALDSVETRQAFIDLGTSVGPTGVRGPALPDRSASVRLFPNPVAETLSLRWLGGEATAPGPDARLHFFGADGSLAAVRPYAPEVDLSALPKGVYAAVLSDGSGARASLGTVTKL